MSVTGAEDALHLTAAAAFYESLGREFEVVEGFRVLLASEGAALEIEQFPDQVVDDVLKAAAIDADFFRVSMLEDDVDVVGLDASIAPIQASEAFHVFTHS